MLFKLDELDQFRRFRARNPNRMADAERMKTNPGPHTARAGRSRDQARYAHFGAVRDVVKGPTIVTVVVRTVVI